MQSKQLQIQTDADADSDRCIAHNQINTEMNESRTCRHQQIQTTDKQQTEHQIQTDNSRDR
ncbi:hypothetical protein Tco_0430395, partial [Tanacetum coccineum]